MNAMPAIFFGHGNPMNALLDNEYTRAWKTIGASLPPPTAIVSISAHWYRPKITVTAMSRPRTIHDFGGFPRELFEVDYPAAGDLTLAYEVQELLAPASVALDTEEWGLDHGTWSVLVHAFPDASIPVVQLSIDERKSAAQHYEMGRRLARLRKEGVLVMGTGNLVHNLHAYAWGDHVTEPFDWADRFESAARVAIVNGDDLRLVDYENQGDDARLSAPTPEHILPLLYVLGTRQKNEEVSFPVTGVDGGSVSMLTMRLG
jgi:4,5-DOPA dioxygenase extradiol